MDHNNNITDKLLGLTQANADTGNKESEQQLSPLRKQLTGKQEQQQRIFLSDITFTEKW